MNLVLEPMVTKARCQLDEIFEHGTPEAKENVLLFLRLHQSMLQFKPEAAEQIQVQREMLDAHLGYIIRQWRGEPT